jgi:hypothetical protein
MTSPMRQADRNDGASKDSRPLSKADKIQIWEHFVSSGGADKERMITIITWLLGLSATLLGYFGAQIFDPGMGPFGVPSRAGVPAVFGMLASLFACYIEWEYRRHATWNWNRADDFANEPQLIELKERPPGQTNVFCIFRTLALVSLLLHAAVFVGSVWLPKLGEIAL